MSMNKIVTIGAIGYTADAFFSALQEAGVDTFVDVRRRRAVRGAAYAFANSQRLQARLAELGIRYLHRLDLAPPTTVRQQQAAADAAPAAEEKPAPKPASGRPAIQIKHPAIKIAANPKPEPAAEEKSAPGKIRISIKK